MVGASPTPGVIPKTQARKGRVMRCDRCGRVIPPGDGTEVTVNDSSGLRLYHTRTKLIHLCPACVRRRRLLPWLLLGFLAAILAGMAVIGYFVRP